MSISIISNNSINNNNSNIIVCCSTNLLQNNININNTNNINNSCDSSGNNISSKLNHTTIINNNNNTIITTNINIPPQIARTTEVSPSTLKGLKKGQFLVYFFGSRDYGFITDKQIKRYNTKDLMSQKLKAGDIKKMNKAIEEANEWADNNNSRDYPVFIPETKKAKKTQTQDRDYTPTKKKPVAARGGRRGRITVKKEPQYQQNSEEIFDSINYDQQSINSTPSTNKKRSPLPFIKDINNNSNINNSNNNININGNNNNGNKLFGTPQQSQQQAAITPLSHRRKQLEFPLSPFKPTTMNSPMVKKEKDIVLDFNLIQPDQIELELIHLLGLYGPISLEDLKLRSYLLEDLVMRDYLEVVSTYESTNDQWTLKNEKYSLINETWHGYNNEQDKIIIRDRKRIALSILENNSNNNNDDNNNSNDISNNNNDISNNNNDNSNNSNDISNNNNDDDNNENDTSHDLDRTQKELIYKATSTTTTTTTTSPTQPTLMISKKPQPQIMNTPKKNKSAPPTTTTSTAFKDTLDIITPIKSKSALSFSSYSTISALDGQHENNTSTESGASDFKSHDLLQPNSEMDTTIPLLDDNPSSLPDYNDFEEEIECTQSNTVVVNSGSANASGSSQPGSNNSSNNSSSSNNNNNTLATSTTTTTTTINNIYFNNNFSNNNIIPINSQATQVTQTPPTPPSSHNNSFKISSTPYSSPGIPATLIVSPSSSHKKKPNNFYNSSPDDSSDGDYIAPTIPINFGSPMENDNNNNNNNNKNNNNNNHNHNHQNTSTIIIDQAHLKEIVNDSEQLKSVIKDSITDLFSTHFKQHAFKDIKSLVEKELNNKVNDMKESIVEELQEQIGKESKKRKKSIQTIIHTLTDLEQTICTLKQNLEKLVD
ncbi:hypothetical protein PPL_00812 [Heterostelium album PN500]|uniref:PWWP domain-containing protein n=1 Tax=Heterostelium pallidum (strain ATCC 26659 / Pp 5 / PN500) TaxID=670386 RepID=D3AXI1_HETP5|nr:hypothetical protein PPL_00812 [Heterostelium album PN500]EFA86250.1 hypothetical protein PPL_00812 [Heterostelium album PN500]|eukprot:XP_020438355.1 hypothetical protein PPL_00812 [Heterostelium album PN500]